MLVQHFLKFFYAAAEPFCLLSLNGDILAFNPAMTELTGYSHRMAKGLPFRQFLAANQEALPAYLKTAASGTDTSPGSLKLFNTDKQVIDYHSKACLLWPVDSNDSPCLLLRLQLNGHQEKIFALLNAELETLRQKHHSLRKQKTQLSEYVKERSEKLNEEIKRRKAAQKTLLQAEKMAALGSLVSGVAHEINTPIGIGVTGASHLEDISRHFKQLFAEDRMKKSDLSQFLNECEKTAYIIHSNLRRASNLIHSFKQVAVDQSTEERRCFNLKAYLDDVLLSLYPSLKNSSHHITLRCSEDIELHSYPGVFSQILTNLIMNSLTHGFENKKNGKITIDVERKKGHLLLTYQDDGKGMNQELRNKVFDPFFTTKRGKGGSGLGMHVVFNLISEKLSGTIKCISQPGQGVSYRIVIPLS